MAGLNNKDGCDKDGFVTADSCSPSELLYHFNMAPYVFMYADRPALANNYKDSDSKRLSKLITTSTRAKFLKE